MARRKTWAEKFAGAPEPHVEVLGKPYAGFPPGARMLISSPKALDAAVRAVQTGKFINIKDFREDIAAENDVDLVCPLTTGIFLRIVSEVALEAMETGAPVDAVTPFWRVVDPKSPLAGKLSCGPERIAGLRAAEQGA